MSQTVKCARRSQLSVAVVRLVRNTLDFAEFYALDRGVMSGFHR